MVNDIILLLKGFNNMGIYMFMHENKRHHVVCSGIDRDSAVTLSIENTPILAVQGMGNPENNITIPQGVNGAAVHNYMTKKIKDWALSWMEGTAKW